METPAAAIRWPARSRRPGLRFAGLMMYPPEPAGQTTPAVFRRIAGRGQRQGLDAASFPPAARRPEKPGGLKRATEDRPGTYIYLDRFQVAAGIAEGRCALKISPPWSAARPGPRHPGCRLEDADIGPGWRARRLRADPGAPGGEDRALCRRARLSRSGPQQHAARRRRRRAHRSQPCLRRRQHDGRGGDGARRRNHRHAAGRGTGEVALNGS